MTERHWESQFDDYTSRILGTLTSESIGLMIRYEAKRLGFREYYSWCILRERGQIIVTTSTAVSEADVEELFSAVEFTMMKKARVYYQRTKATYHKETNTYVVLLNRWEITAYKDCNDMRTLCAVMDELSRARKNPLKAMAELHGRLEVSLDRDAKGK